MRDMTQQQRTVDECRLDLRPLPAVICDALINRRCRKLDPPLVWTIGRVRLDDQHDSDDAEVSSSQLAASFDGLAVVVLEVVVVAVKPLTGANWTGPLAARSCR